MRQRLEKQDLHPPSMERWERKGYLDGYHEHVDRFYRCH